MENDFCENDLIINKPPKMIAHRPPVVMMSQFPTNAAFVAIARPKHATIPSRQSIICDRSDKSCPGKEGYFNLRLFHPAGGRHLR